MEVILLKDQDAGQRGEVVEVKPGYARNFLLPRGLALRATQGNIRRFEQMRHKIEAEMAKEREEAQKVADRVSAMRIIVHKRTSDGTNLYGSVTATEIGDEMEKQDVVVDRRRIVLDSAIKRIGDHHVPVKLHPEVIAELVVTVLPEEEEELDATAELEAVPTEIVEPS